MLPGRPLDKPDPHKSDRPEELEDWLNRSIYHRLSMPVARVLSRTFVTPNMVSIAGGLTVVLAGLVYVRFDSTAGAVAGLLLHMFWHVLDGADGDLARITGRASAFGELVDGLCDYVSHLALYLLLAAVLAEQIGPWGWVLMVGAGLARIPQTVFYETQRRQYQYWVYGKEWLRISTGEGQQRRGVFAGIARFYLWVSHKLEAGGGSLDAAFARASEAERAAMRAELKARFGPVLRPLSLLSSNYRTLGIGLAIMLGSPLYYVFFELVGLSVLAAVLLYRAAKVIGQVEASTSR